MASNTDVGPDYRCWDPATVLARLGEIELSDADRQKLFHDNARRILNLRDRSTDTAGTLAAIKEAAARQSAGLRECSLKKGSSPPCVSTRTCSSSRSE
jgi:hypothetical protein